MARKTNHKFQRNKRERARQERAAARRSRRAQRAESKGPDADDDLAGIVAGPQQKDKASDDEIQLAIERAMNPGSVRNAGRDAAAGHHTDTARLFVGNLDFGTNEQELGEFFADAGFTVLEARVVKDRVTGQPRGFAFVELASTDDAQRAIDELDGVELRGRMLRVNPADRRS